MPKLACIDPHDPYAQREVLVEFECIGSGFRLIAAVDDCDDDILSDLVDAQRDDLLREIADAGLFAAAVVRPPLACEGARPSVPC